MNGSPGGVYEARPLTAADVIGHRWRLWLQLDARGWQNATLLSLLLALEFAALMLTPMSAADTDSFWDLVGMAAIGSSLAPPTLLALWAVFGFGRASVRLPLTIWLAGASYVTLLFGAAHEHGDAAADGYLYLSFWLLAFAFMQLPLWLIRAVRRWRLVQTAVGAPFAGPAPADCREKPGNHLTLRALMGWVLAAAVLFAATRALMPKTAPGASAALDALPDLALGGLLVASAGLPTLALTWILLAAGRRPVLRLVLSFLLLAGPPAGVWLLCGDDSIQPAESVCLLLGATAVVTITDAGLAPLADHPELQELDLHDTAITDQGLNTIAKLTALKKLDVRGTQVTPEGILRLAKSLPRCEIVR